MPFVTPGTVVAGGVLTAARYNSDVVANTQYLYDLVTTQSFTASSAVSVNDCFSSEYTNYRVIIQCDSSSGNTDLRLRLRVGGVDNNTANSYARQVVQGNGSSTAAARDNFDTLVLGSMSDQTGSVFTLDIMRPFEATRTSFLCNNLYITSGDAPLIYFTNAFHDQSTSYDGMTFYPSGVSLTTTGHFWVYGYKD
jgi:hypothetical protein